MILLATIGAKSLYLLFLWLVSAAAAAWLADRKGYGERLGLTFGLILSAAGLVVLLLLPGRPGSKWVEDVPPPDYPMRLQVDRPQRLSRLSTALRGLLALPHVVVLSILGAGALVAQLIAAIAVLVTGRYPRGLFDFQLGTLRWGARVSAYQLLLTDSYPPFSLQGGEGYPVRLEVDYPERIARWRPLVNWILAAPLAVVTVVLLAIGSLLAFEAWVAILITGRYPEGLFVNLTTSLRWTLRQSVFQLGLTERYPPLTWA